MSQHQQDFEALDPEQIAPATTVFYRANADQVGHGRTLPMIGGVRNHLLDVLPDPLLMGDAPRVRVYADTAAGVLGALIPGYQPIAARMEEALSPGDTGTDPELVEDGWLARYQHAAQMKRLLQQKLNHQAQQSGRWDALTDAEREQLAGSAEGLIPFGIQQVVPVAGPDGDIIEYEVDVWSTPRATLVINSGDYGPASIVFDDDLGWNPEPVSMMPVPDDHAGELVPLFAIPPNLIALDPTSDDLYLRSLEAAGLLTIATNLPLQPSALWNESVVVGEAINDGRIVEGGTDTYATLTADAVAAP